MDKPLSAIRAAIDAADAKILALLNERAALSVEAGKTKPGGDAVYRPGREAGLLRALAAANAGPLPDSHLEAVYREILSSSRALQRVESVGFCGPAGADPLRAAMDACQTAWRAFGSRSRYLPLDCPAGVFYCVHERRCDMGIVPTETGCSGYNTEIIDLFARFPVFIRAEFFHQRGPDPATATGAAPAQWTRYVVIGLTPADRPEADKSAILFSLRDNARRLSQTLRIFSDAGFGAARLQSRPQDGRPRFSTYFAEFSGDVPEDRFAAALTKAAGLCAGLKTLGSYPAWTL